MGQITEATIAMIRNSLDAGDRPPLTLNEYRQLAYLAEQQIKTHANAQGEPVAWLMQAVQNRSLIDYFSPAQPHQKAKHPNLWTDAFPVYRTGAQGVPDGWKLVPIEPTDEMVRVAELADEFYAVEIIYSAMVAAAPEFKP